MASSGLTHCLCAHAPDRWTGGETDIRIIANISSPDVSLTVVRSVKERLIVMITAWISLSNYFDVQIPVSKTSVTPPDGRYNVAQYKYTCTTGGTFFFAMNVGVPAGGNAQVRSHS
jgi:hypothetical protein